MNSIISFMKDAEYRNLLITTVIMIVIGTFVYHKLESWSWVDSFYFSVVALTTVGFGDLTPQTDLGKLFTVIYLITGVGLILTFIDIVYKHYLNRKV